MPPELPRNMVPGWRWQRGGGQPSPAQPWRAIQCCSPCKDAARRCLGRQEELIVLKPASAFLSGSSRAHSTLHLENIPVELLLDQCPHKLIQQLNLLLGRFKTSCSA